MCEKRKAVAYVSRDSVCPVERADTLDNRFRRRLQNPNKILKPYIREGMCVMDFGCGPGYFAIEMAKMVGNSGVVLAVDLQEGMIKKLKAKITDKDYGKLIKLIKTEVNKINIPEMIDFALVFYVVHKIKNKESFFRELVAVLKPDGKVLMCEPPIHVSKSAFTETVEKAKIAGLEPEKGPRIFLEEQ